MAKRTSRDYEATLEQQLKQFKPVRVNPFPKMMDAARHSHVQLATKQNAAAEPAPGHNSSTMPVVMQAAMACTLCSHCGVGLSELQVQQCHSCKSVYCSSCSVINYDEREDRIFCLDCNEDCMQLTSCEDADMDYAGSNSRIYGTNTQQHQQQQHHYYNKPEQQPHQVYHHQQQQEGPFLCSPPGRDMLGSCQAGSLSAERRSSVMRACNMAAAAAAAAADSGGSCMAAMAGISGLRQEQMTPLFAQGGLCGGFGGSSAGRVQRGGVLGQWDLNSPPLARITQGMMATAAVLPFTAGC